MAKKINKKTDKKVSDDVPKKVTKKTQKKEKKIPVVETKPIEKVLEQQEEQPESEEQKISVETKSMEIEDSEDEPIEEASISVPSVSVQPNNRITIDGPKKSNKIVFDDNDDTFENTEINYGIDEMINEKPKEELKVEPSKVPEDEFLSFLADESDEAPEEMNLSKAKEEQEKQNQIQKNILEEEENKKKAKKQSLQEKKNKKELSQNVLDILSQNSGLLEGQSKNSKKKNNLDYFMEEEEEEEPEGTRIRIEKGTDIHVKKNHFDLVKLSDITERVVSEGIPANVQQFLTEHFYGSNIQRMAAGKYMKEKKSRKDKTKNIKKN
ncbi:hypothetical protein WA158_002565 [Blastocystis sp. Blastoise]